MAWCPFKFKITHFLLVGTTKVVIFTFFYVPFLWGSFRCNIAAKTFSFAAWYVLCISACRWDFNGAQFSYLYRTLKIQRMMCSMQSN